MSGLLLKTARESWAGALLFGIGLAVVMALLTHILPQVQQGVSDLLGDMPFVKTLMQALLGTEAGTTLSAQMMQSLLWVHPVVLALLWGHEIIFCTRVPAGEIDRGTVDFLLSLPISRRSVYHAETLLWLATGLWLLMAGFAGHLATRSSLPEPTRPSLVSILQILTNLYCVYLAVGGLAFLVSSLSSHRGKAVGVVFALLLASFLLNFLAQFWPIAKRLAVLGVLHYYRPAAILESGETPWINMAVLVAVGVAAWILGREFFQRRNIVTV